MEAKFITHNQALKFFRLIGKDWTMTTPERELDRLEKGEIVEIAYRYGCKIKRIECFEHLLLVSLTISELRAAFNSIGEFGNIDSDFYYVESSSPIFNSNNQQFNFTNEELDDLRESLLISIDELNKYKNPIWRTSKFEELLIKLGGHLKG